MDTGTVGRQEASSREQASQNWQRRWRDDGEEQ